MFPKALPEILFHPTFSRCSRQCRNLISFPSIISGSLEHLCAVSIVTDSLKPNSKILGSQHDLFEIKSGVTFLNCSSLSPQLRSVTAAGMESVKSKVSPWLITPQDWFSGPEHLRSLAARVMTCDSDGVALVPSVSYGIAVAAANVKVDRGQSIVLLSEQYPSNVYAWQKLAQQRCANIRTVTREPDGTWTQAVLRSIDDSTAVVAVPLCHWTDGSLIDLVKVSTKVQVVGAALVVDASQSVGAYPLNLAQIQPDFLVSVGYKWLLGPYSLGYLYVAPHWREFGEPIEHSWLSRAGAEDFARLVDYKDAFKSGARRFDAGEYPNFVLVPMAIAALSQILDWGVENIQLSLSVLTNMVEREAVKLGCTTLPASSRVGHMIGIRIPGGIPAQLSTRLKEANIYVSFRGDSIRVAPHLYNDESDIDRFFGILQKVL